VLWVSAVNQRPFVVLGFVGALLFGACSNRSLGEPDGGSNTGTAGGSTAGTAGGSTAGTAGGSNAGSTAGTAGGSKGEGAGAGTQGSPAKGAGGGTGGAVAASPGTAGTTAIDDPGQAGAMGVSQPGTFPVTSVDASECSIESVAIDPTSLCPGVSACPATTLLRLGCMSDNVLSLDVHGTAGASLAINQSFDLILYTLEPAGTSHAERFPQFVNAVVRADAAGHANIFVEAGQPGVWRVRETPAGWLREDVQVNPSMYADVSDGRALDDTHASVVIADGVGISLFGRDAAGWRLTRGDLFPGFEVLELSTGMNVDAAGGAWVAAVTYHDPVFRGYTPTEFLDLVGPDGALETIKSLVGDIPLDPPTVLPGGLTGMTARPAVAYRQADGVHVALPPGVPTGWTDRLLPGTAALAPDAATCLPDNAPPCSTDACLTQSHGATQGVGFARTASGATFAAWLDVASSTDACDTTNPVPTGTSTIVVARVPSDASAPATTQRFRLPGVADPTAPLTMTTRRDTLLIATQVSSSAAWYLEVDATKLP
jgi:hypothetical protein